jgi:hypothetical protein
MVESLEYVYRLRAFLSFLAAALPLVESTLFLGTVEVAAAVAGMGASKNSWTALALAAVVGATFLVATTYCMLGSP